MIKDQNPLKIIIGNINVFRREVTDVKEMIKTKIDFGLIAETKNQLFIS